MEEKNIVETVEVSNEETPKKPKKWWKTTLKATGITFGSIIALVLVVFLSLDLIKFSLYKEYYSMRDIICTNHGMDDNYISQGTAITDDGKYIITSGYMSDKTHSRIYITDIATDKTHYVKVNKPNGEKCTYHFGGVGYYNNTIYIASAEAVFTIPFDEALTVDEISMTKLLDSKTSASFIFVNQTHLYVGEFYKKGNYDTTNQIEHAGVTYNAIVEGYSHDDYTVPEITYAIREKIQGFAINEKGEILLSSSWSLSASKFYFYKKADIIETYGDYNGSGVQALNEPTIEFEGPAMSEDLDYHDGKFYTNFESSCNKYFFGKLFISTDKIVSLDVNTFVKNLKK